MHTTLAIAWFAATVARVAPAVVAIVLVAASSSLAADGFPLLQQRLPFQMQKLSLMLQRYLNSSRNDILKVPELYLAMPTRRGGWTRLDIRSTLRDVGKINHRL